MPGDAYAATGVGRTRHSRRQLAAGTRRSQAIYENYALEPPRASRKAPCASTASRLFERQYDLKRVADVLIDLFVGLCVISRAESLIASQPDTREQVIEVAEVFTHQARRRMVRNIRGAAHNEDARSMHWPAR